MVFRTQRRCERLDIEGGLPVDFQTVCHSLAGVENRRVAATAELVPEGVERGVGELAG